MKKILLIICVLPLVLCQSECPKGWYRTPRIAVHEPGDCHRCTKCDENNSVLIRSCKDNKDAVCCPGQNYHVEEGTDGRARCVLYCERGQFLDIKTNTCETCPEGTFMDKENHTSEDCIFCPVPNPSEVEIWGCNKTHPTVIACISGFYGTPAGYGLDCHPCQVCQYNETHPYHGLACDTTHDTVCCKEPNMTVVSTPRGQRQLQCQPTPTHPVTLTPASTEVTDANKEMITSKKVTETTQKDITTPATDNEGNVAVTVVSVILILLSPFVCMPVELYRGIWLRVRNLAGNT